MVDIINNSNESIHKQAEDSIIHKQADGSRWREYSLSPKEEADWMIDRAEAAGVELSKNGYDYSKKDLDEFDKVHLKLADSYDELTEAVIVRGASKNLWNLAGSLGGGIAATIGFLKQGKAIHQKVDKIERAILSEVKENAAMFLDIASIRKDSSRKDSSSEKIIKIAKKWADKTKLTGGAKDEAIKWFENSLEKIRDNEGDGFKLTKGGLSKNVSNEIKPFRKRINTLFKYAIDSNKYDHKQVFDEAVKPRVEKALANNNIAPISDNIMNKVKEYYVDYALNGTNISSIDINKLIETDARGVTGTLKFRLPMVVATAVAGVAVSDLAYNIFHGDEKKKIDLLKDKVKHVNDMVKQHGKPGVKVSLPSEKISERVDESRLSHISTKI